jgi:VCBS repeat-containing protein
MRRVAVLLPIALMLAACGGGGGSTTATSGASGTPLKTVQISEKEFSLSPGTVSLSKTGSYEFKVTNNGTVPHALEVQGNGIEQKTGTIAPGASATLSVTLSKTGSYDMYCPVDGHRAQGMKGSVTVGGGSTSGPGTTTTSTKPGY